MLRAVGIALGGIARTTTTEAGAVTTRS